MTPNDSLRIGPIGPIGPIAAATPAPSPAAILRSAAYWLLCLIALSLASCKCPPPLADGTKPPCIYVGPSVTGSISFQGVTAGITLWNDVKHPPEPTTEPLTITK